MGAKTMMETIFEIFWPHVPAMLTGIAIVVVGLVLIYYWRKAGAAADSGRG